MAGELLKIDTIVADGIALSFEDSSGELEGMAGWEHTAVLAASGDDSTSRKRIPRMLNLKLLMKAGQTPPDFAAMKDVQITARDSQAGMRCVMTRCTFAKMGKFGGGGSVEVTFNVLSEPQWL